MLKFVDLKVKFVFARAEQLCITTLVQHSTSDAINQTHRNYSVQVIFSANMNVGIRSGDEIGDLKLCFGRERFWPLVKVGVLGIQFRRGLIVGLGR